MGTWNRLALALIQAVSISCLLPTTEYSSRLETRARVAISRVLVAAWLPSAFAHSAAYGDMLGAALALLSLASLRSAAGVAIVWLFNLWATADLFDAFYQANHAGLMPGQLGAAYFIPTLVVPLLLVTHGLAFRIITSGHRAAQMTIERGLRGHAPV